MATVPDDLPGDRDDDWRLLIEQLTALGSPGRERIIDQARATGVVVGYLASPRHRYILRGWIGDEIAAELAAELLT